jgi:uncharacterized protein (TIGR04141 family)
LHKVLTRRRHFRDAHFRQLALGRCPASHQAIFNGEPRSSDFTIIHAIITHAAGNLRNALPFFSKQSLANAGEMLRNMGYQVQLKEFAVM